MRAKMIRAIYDFTLDWIVAIVIAKRRMWSVLEQSFRQK